MLHVTLLKESGLWPGVQINFSILLQSVDTETLLNSCTARVTCMDHLGLSKQTVLWLRTCSRWAQLAVSNSCGRNHEPIAHTFGEQVNLKSFNTKILFFSGKKNHWNITKNKKKKEKKREGVVTESFYLQSIVITLAKQKEQSSYASAHFSDLFSFASVLRLSIPSLHPGIMTPPPPVNPGILLGCPNAIAKATNNTVTKFRTRCRELRANIRDSTELFTLVKEQKKDLCLQFA